VYLCPPLVGGLQTGSIVKRKRDEAMFVVLNPACDLVVRRNGDFKTDRILLAEIDGDILIDEVTGRQNSRNAAELKSIESCKHHNPESKSYKRTLGYQKEAIERCVSGLFRNTYDHFHHWLPKTALFLGGFINFRKLSTLTKDDFGREFDPPQIQISPSFVKDVVSRFSSYYARQGQPDIDCKDIISALTAPGER
jgi:hypothetical protein